jgi:hypothetical protein
MTEDKIPHSTTTAGTRYTDGNPYGATMSTPLYANENVYSAASPSDRVHYGSNPIREPMDIVEYYNEDPIYATMDTNIPDDELQRHILESLTSEGGGGKGNGRDENAKHQNIESIQIEELE